MVTFAAHALTCLVCGDPSQPVLCAIGAALWRPVPKVAVVTARRRKGLVDGPRLVEDDAA